ncbi:hypothetical protein PAL_GLEAN10010476 [Pteropus alecto]|uniref:Uncharacterized protein n=1 Tax=Pteropus alecto TaxID=9402 RepID=L5KJ92_PTEAL|nr:hypothetical protein PAL_GLEAN10010476 [Pteropus alecto]
MREGARGGVGGRSREPLPTSAGTSCEACSSCNCVYEGLGLQQVAAHCWMLRAKQELFCSALSAPPGGLPFSAQPDPTTVVCSQEAGRVLAPTAPGRRTQRGLKVPKAPPAATSPPAAGHF